MNTQIRIARLPQGQPQESDFELVRGQRPQPGAGQILVRTRWLSLDPYVRSLLSGRHFLRMPQPGDVMPAKAVAGSSSHAIRCCRRRQARARDGLAEWAVSDGDEAWRLDPRHLPASTALGILGMPGMTAYFGLRETAQLRASETVLVSAASGPVSSMVQAARTPLGRPRDRHCGRRGEVRLGAAQRALRGLHRLQVRGRRRAAARTRARGRRRVLRQHLR
ncbi:MAG: hypothetical protein R3E65_00920 [Steroidobacteraceae bacterium]